MPDYLVERYEPGISAETLRADALRLSSAVEALRREGASIDFGGLTFVPGDEGVFASFKSTSQALVALAHRRAQVPFERIVETEPVNVEG